MKTNLLKLKITKLDMNGYWGRENHPAETDRGLVVTALRMDVLAYDPGEGGAAPVLEVLDKVKQYVPETGDASWMAFEVCYTCLTADGRLLDLMSHEVEVADESR